jgi:multidrug efflux pump subunit AcrA (membrane-fusion protein)
VPEEGAPSDLRVPIGALFDRGGGPGVWTVLEKPQRVTWRSIKVNRIDGDTVGVREGLKQGDRVVALGAHVLHEGQQVRLAAEPSNQKPAAEAGAP